jgi:hypothetical protein
VFILEDMNELDSARALIGGLLRGGQITDANELKFLSGRLDRLDRLNKPNRPDQSGQSDELNTLNPPVPRHNDAKR